MRKFTIHIKVKIFKENEGYIAFSPELQIATQGSSIEQVKKRFEERISIFVDRAMETGTLEKRLEKLGWEVKRKKPIPPKEVTLPTELLHAKECESMDYDYAI